MLHWSAHQGRLSRGAQPEVNFALKHSHLAEENHMETYQACWPSANVSKVLCRPPFLLQDLLNGEFVLRSQLLENSPRWRLRARISDAGKLPLTWSKLRTEPRNGFWWRLPADSITPRKSRKVLSTVQTLRLSLKIYRDSESDLAQLRQYQTARPPFPKQCRSMSMLKAQNTLPSVFVQWDGWEFNLFKFTIVCRIPEPAYSEQRDLWESFDFCEQDQSWFMATNRDSYC